jgi:DNA-binding transcriptional MerR regulator
MSSESLKSSETLIKGKIINRMELYSIAGFSIIRNLLLNYSEATNYSKGGLNMSQQFLKAYSIKEVSEKTGVAQGTIRQWEKDLEDVFIVQRDSKGNRLYTDFEIDLINKIKEMRDKNVSIAMIKGLMKKRSETFGADLQPLVVQPTIPQMTQNEAITTLKELQVAMQSFEAFKEQLEINIANRIRNEIRNEITTEVVNQIAATSIVSKEQLDTITSSISNNSEVVSKLSKTLDDELKRVEEDRRRAEEDRKLIIERDKQLLANMRVLQEIREEQNKGFFEKLFSKKKKSN